MTNKKKKNSYLVIIDDAKRSDMDKFKDIVGEKQIKMASENSLFEKMMLPAGVVSPFGLLNNVEKDIQVYFDKEIVNAAILREACRKTFMYRKIEFDIGKIIDLLEILKTNEAFLKRWQAYSRKNLYAGDITFEEVLDNGIEMVKKMEIKY